MKITLGYVALPLSISVTSSHTITYSSYLKSNKDNILLDKVIKNNLEGLKEILEYNIKNNIRFYRMTSKLIPLSTHKLVKYNYKNKYDSEFKNIGSIIKNNNLRVDTHPEEFCILNSINENVVNSSIDILKYHYFLFEKMNIESKIILHIGSSVPSKAEALERFKKNFLRLDKKIRNSIILENDDKIYNILDVLNLCKELNIPMVLDYHHFLCNNNGEFLEDYLGEIFETWSNSKINPKIHFSSPKNSKEYRSHNDYIDTSSFIKFIDIIKKYDVDVDIMLEAKAKDEALFRLIRNLKYKTDYKFVDDTTFIIEGKS